MSLPKLTERRALLSAAAALPLLAAGCTFRPLYRPVGNVAAAPERQLAAIRIVPLGERLGQQMHNALRNELNPRGQPSNPSYRLVVSLGETIDEVAIRRDETASRNDVVLMAFFRLLREDSGEQLVSASSRVTDSYDVVAAAFATDAALDAARERNVRSLAKQIRLQLASYFASAEQRGS